MPGKDGKVEEVFVEGQGKAGEVPGFQAEVHVEVYTGAYHRVLSDTVKREGDFWHKRLASL